MSENIIIVGAGHGGGTAAASLRQAGFRGAITLITEEDLAPYHRPPLSKAWLKGEADGASLALRAPNYYADSNIELRLQTRVNQLDPHAQTITLHDGTILPWSYLILATGARARALQVAGADSHGILALRNAADADALKAALRPGTRLAVVGGGYIGLEVAASARAIGAEVIVFEREPRLLSRVASPDLSAFFEATHRAHGVRIELAAELDAFESAADHVTGILLRDGSVIKCDAAVVGIGAIPNDELARHAGLLCEAGVVVDENARTSHPAIYAIGDMTWRPLAHYGRMWRLESVPNAVEQARQAAASITGTPRPTEEVPWFWSDQYDIKLQIAGLPFGATSTLVRGDPGAKKFAVFHLRENRLVAVEAVNATAEFIAGRKLIANATPIVPELLADPAVSMKSVAV